MTCRTKRPPGLKAPAAAEEDLEVVVPDRLQHLDGDDAVVRPLQIAVVHQPQVDAVRQPLRLHALLRESELRPRW